MWEFVKGHFRAIASIYLYVVETLFLTIPFYVMVAIKFLIPDRKRRQSINRALYFIGDIWVYFLTLPQRLSKRTRWVIDGIDSFTTTKSCLLMVNHQTWTDIWVLLRLFYGKIPDVKFFMKKELLWIPILGQALWAVDFPIMRRYSKEALKQNPQLAGKDLEETKKSCEKFVNEQVSIFNFVEGTRFREDKHRKQKSAFKHLLKPKAGGTALVLNSMGEKIQNILNVTIVYPEGVKSFWDFLCGKVGEIRVNVEVVPVKKELIGDYFHDPKYRRKFQSWLNNLWCEKDKLIDEMLEWEPV